MGSIPLAQLAYSADDVLSPYIFVFYIAFILSFAFTPIMKRVAHFYGVVDNPDMIRKVHQTPTAYLGGIAVFVGWIGGLAISQFLHLHDWIPGMTGHAVLPISIVAAACMIVALGLLDDVRGMRPRLKIAGQVAAAIVLIAFGIGTQTTEPLLRPVGIRMENYFGWDTAAVWWEWLVYASSCAVTIAVVVFCTNATNLMDGLDGLCGGVCSIIAVGLLFLVVYLAMQNSGGINESAIRVILALALLGAVLGFVPYNFNPASIFLGDAGSMFLGFAIATLVIVMAEYEAKWFLGGMVMFALPVLDTSLAFARRILAGRPVFSADKAHFHHQLVHRGFSVKQAVLMSYALSIFFVVCGASLIFFRTRYSIAFYLVIFGCIIVAAYKIGMVHERMVAVERKPLGASDTINPTRSAAGALEVVDRPSSGGIDNGSGATTKTT
jgi:UDP-GlcNAc:undecaprenyl-phosphate/decaprenyl-phosphate GlcNAc-1-phosphate transferase